MIPVRMGWLRESDDAVLKNENSWKKPLCLVWPYQSGSIQRHLGWVGRLYTSAFIFLLLYIIYSIYFIISLYYIESYIMCFILLYLLL